MNAFFRLPLWWITMSDADYVNLVRKQIRYGKRDAVIGVVLGGLILVAAFVVCAITRNALDPEHRANGSAVAAGAAMGALLGTICAVFFFIGILQFLFAFSAIQGFRTEKLLVKYYTQATESATAATPDPEIE